MKTRNKTVASDFIDAIGRDQFRKLGMSDRSIRLAAHDGKFAAAWYQRLRKLAEQHQVYFPEEMFTWKA